MSSFPKSLFETMKARCARRVLIPEVLQTSLMDCGPATLKSVFDGFRRPIHLERLRERCQTDVDGTSLTAIQRAAERSGLEVAQIMVPKDSVLLPETACLPAIIFLESADGLLHFATLWSRIGAWVQVMDPARGRLWVHEKQLLAQIATPTLTLPTARWRAWAGGPDFAAPLIAKMRLAGLSTADATRLLASAASDESVRSLAALDAATRMVRSLIAAGALARGAPSRHLLRRAFEGDRRDRRGDATSIPRPYWICRPGLGPDFVAATGAVLLLIEGVRPEAAAEENSDPDGSVRLRVAIPDGDAARSREARGAPAGTEAIGESEGPGPALSRAVIDELHAPAVRPHRVFARMLWDDSRLAVTFTFGLLALAVATSALDALLMRGVADLVGHVNLVTHRVVAIAALIVFLVLALFFELAQTLLVQRLARGLEARLRVAFLEKLPRLEDRYFRSRPVSDMASRAHLLQTLRGVPRFAVDMVSGVLRVVTAAGVLVWLEPRLWKVVALLLAVCLCLPFVSYRLVDEATARMRVFGAHLFRFYLDALLGVVPIRVHGAARAVRREHEGILTEWVRSGLAVESRTLSLRGVQRFFGTLVAIGVVVLFVSIGADLRALLLIALLAQRLPAEAEALASVVRRYPLLKHDALRIFEPLAAAETAKVRDAERTTRATGGVCVDLLGVTAMAGGRPILSNVTLLIPRGQHVAVVGASGAGKSSLVGVLLGWLVVTDGRVLVDGEPLDASRQATLREETAWVDPSVQIWNASLLDNMLYGHGDDALPELEAALGAADLLEVIERLPDGLRSALGEGGARVSGGQGQRVRLGRALLRRDARLVILDEPFRGLERDKRRELLRRARALFRRATVLFVSHDVADTLGMDRVIVVKDGEIVEDGAPAELLAGQTQYARLVEGDRQASSSIWDRAEWRRLRVTRGVLARRRAETEAPP